MESDRIINRRQAIKVIGAATFASVAAVREFPRVLAQTEGTPVAEQEPLKNIEIITKEIQVVEESKPKYKFVFEPSDVTLTVNEKVAITLKNEGKIPHDWSVLPVDNHEHEDEQSEQDDDMNHDNMMDEHHGHDETQPAFIVFDDHMGDEDGSDEDGNHEHHHEDEGYLLHMYADPGKTEKIVILPTITGEYNFICTVPGHKELGMTGKLIVDDNTAEHDQAHNHERIVFAYT